MSLDAAVGLRRGSLDLDVELTAEPGRVVALLGPNGAGKTSLLRALAGLDPIERGRIVLGGRVLDDPATGVLVPPEQRRVGVVFQDYLLFPHLSALENVAFGLRMRGLRDAESRARAWLGRVGLGDQAGARPGQLSGGQAQRVALARALAVEPQLLLLDEPLAALDATTRAAVRRDLRRHLAEFAGTAILVSHDPVDAAALAGRVVVVEAGRVTQSGEVGDITAHPRSAYVADLVGVNLWRGVARGGEVAVDGAVVRAAGSAEGEVFVLVRPRAVSVHSDEPHGSPRNVWPGRVTSLDATPTGVRARVEGVLTVVAEITPGAVAELGLAGGEEVWVSFKASEVEVYPA